MKHAVFCGAAVLALLAPPAMAQEKPVTIHAGQLLDGRGGARRDVTITVQGGKIVRLGKAAGKPDYEFAALTVLPGLIDSHVHITTHFNNEGRATAAGETGEEKGLKWAENVELTLMAGYTTIQSVGSDDDYALRAAIASGRLAGPRLLTSGKPINNPQMTPDEIRAFVDKTKANGADLIKIFASKSIRDGGTPTMSQEQMDAACGEANKLGMRTWVHAHASEAVRRATLAGCFTVTHAFLASQAEFDLMASKGTFFEPNMGVVLENYLAHRSNYEGIGNYRADAFTSMADFLKQAPAIWDKMYHTKGLKILTGGDTNAGAEGNNADEIVWRVQHGQPAMDAIVSATSTNAEALRLADKVGAIAPGMEADIIAVAGDPLKDITVLKSVRFVMKGGKVYKNVTTD